MIELLKKNIVGYLNGGINNVEFVQKCKELYAQTVGNTAQSIELDAILALPFIHEFAYCEYANSELKQQVLLFCEILNGNKLYQYSTFLRVPPPDKTDRLMSDLYHNLQHITVGELCEVFVQMIDKPTSIKDILNNLIFDILSKLDASDLNENDFDSINCNEDISTVEIKEKVLLLLSYYLGIRPFLVNINKYSNDCTVFTII